MTPNQPFQGHIKPDGYDQQWVGCKVRLRLSSVRKGEWFACYVTDCEPAPDGCRQRPVLHLAGAYGSTPRKAYRNLMKGPAL